jgi:hypothetical protein
MRTFNKIIALNFSTNAITLPLSKLLIVWTDGRIDRQMIAYTFMNGQMDRQTDGRDAD